MHGTPFPLRNAALDPSLLPAVPRPPLYPRPEHFNRTVRHIASTRSATVRVRGGNQCILLAVLPSPVRHALK
jgi:hypothetical protein